MRTIVIVDDNPDDVFMTKRLLAKARISHPTVEFEDGALAIEYLKEAVAQGRLPLLVLLDLNMPVANGFDVLKWSRKQRALDPIPFVMLSTSGDHRDKSRARRLGATAYLIKFPPVEAFRLALAAFLPGAAPRQT